MSHARRAGAPRLIEWTGERCVPWAPDVQVVYEHYHRYLWARRLVAGRRVLDLGSGEGFGSALLAEAAREVVGIDIDARSIEHSRLNYAGPGLDFRVGSATDLGDYPEDAFDAVVAFEVIEHIADQDAVLAEVARVLAPDGLLVLSTPDRLAYADATPEANPFHERELTQAELTGLLSTRFRSLALFGQRTATGSRIEALSPSAEGGHVGVQIERAGDEWGLAGPMSPLYVLAVASESPLPELPASSTLSDYGLGLVRQAEGERNTALERLEEVRKAAEEAADERDRLGSQLVSSTHELEEARREAWEKGLALARIEQSVSWRLLQRVSGRLYAAIGRNSVAGRGLGATLRLVGRKAFSEERPATGWPPLELPRFDHPEVSIVIPVHAGAELTHRCLAAILQAGDDVPYEVIVVDDAADPDTKAVLAAVGGARILVNDENLGYLRSVNKGAEIAVGRHLVLLNNDTEPTPGWLTAFVERAESAADVGVVTAKLRYPDGMLQEAGGIVWRDGVAWNYGNRRDPAEPEYNYVREVDYGSAAALLVRAELWRAAGGFDERFAPGYFEDTDLCFTARALGWRVLYEPRADVVHHEGGSMGTDLSAGGKRHQQLNQPKFAAKWRGALREQPANPSWERAHMASDRRRGRHVLVIDHRVPTPDQDSGSLRMWRMLEGFLEIGCRVTFLPDDGHPSQPYASQLQSMGIEVLAGPIDVRGRIADLAPSLTLALLSRPYVAPRYMHLLREYAPEALVAYDTVDLHFLREERRARSSAGANPALPETYRELELGLARAADVTLVVSDEDREHLAALAPDATLRVVPNANEIAADVPGPEGRSGLLFVGGFEHLPNVDAALYMAAEIMPRIRHALPDATLTIVGSKAPREVTALASPRVAVRGWVEKLEPLLREHLVMVAPLRYGAGMKGKVTQSLGAGLPVVTTSIGAEGLDAVDGRELLIADDPQAFADRVVQLHHDHETWRRMSAEGQELARRTCSPAVQWEALRGLLDIRARRTAESTTAATG